MPFASQSLTKLPRRRRASAAHLAADLGPDLGSVPGPELARWQRGEREAGRRAWEAARRRQGWEWSVGPRARG